MATKKMSLHASKKRSNSSPELQLQVTDIDMFLAASASVVDDKNGVTSGETSTRSNWQLGNGLGDNAKASNVHSSEVDCSVKSQACSLKQSMSKVEDETPQPSVRPKVRNGQFKTKTKPTHTLASRRRQNKVGADSIVMAVDGSNSESSTDAEEVCAPSKGQVFGRVANLLVAHFRHRTQKRQRRGSNSDSDSSASAKDVEMNLPRPRSKSFSGRIMRKLGSKEKGVSGMDSPHRELPKRKAQSHVSRIQSCIGVVFTSKQKSRPPKCEVQTQQQRRCTPIINLEDFNPDEYPTECEDDIQRVLREQEIRDGVEPPPGYQPQFLAEVETHSQAVIKNAEKPYHDTGKDGKIKDTLPVHVSETTTSNVPTATTNRGSSHTTANIYDQFGSLTPDGLYIPRTVHTQIDYMHCLVPDQKSIIGSSFYWGKIDRFEADLLLENKPEGTFLLRDSAHDEFVFSVSFRRYGRTLHARIEQWKHKFSFDAHDPGVYSSDTICGLLKHYKDPNFCMFFEPMLTIPLPRPNPPSLQELARATVCSNTTYDGITRLALPRTLKEYSREYHYKQRVRMRRFEVPEMPVAAEPQIGIITKTCISR